MSGLWFPIVLWSFAFPGPQTETPDATASHYPTILAQIQTARQALADRYHQEPHNRSALMAEAETLLSSAIGKNLAPFWYGTGWAFNGTTETPGVGKIACGYFVTTLLRDAGFDLPRIRMAQVASETMIRSLVSEDHIKRFSDAAIEDFSKAVRQWGPGLYVVGLDMHTGFIFCANGKVWFLHASYQPPYQVIKEPIERSAILVASRYRVLGKLSDPTLLRKWFLGEKITLR